MPNQVYCAECGTELLFLLKALPKQQMTITVVEPHTCPDEDPENPFKDNNNELITKDKKDKSRLNKIFDSFKFNKKVGGKDSEPKNTVIPKKIIDPFEPGDLRPDEDLVKSIAPQGILGSVRTMGNTTPENGLKE